MKKITTIFLFIAVLFSCDNSSDPVVEYVAEYELTDVKYFLKEGDNIHTDTIQIDKRVITNNAETFVTLTIKSDELNKPAESSSFNKDEEIPPLKIYSGETTKIRIPYLIENNTIILDPSESYEYTEFTQQLTFDKGQTEWSFNITPYNQYIVTIYVAVDQITTHYTAIFTERKSRETKLINGQWEGKRIKKFIVNEQINEIK